MPQPSLADLLNARWLQGQPMPSDVAKRLRTAVWQLGVATIGSATPPASKTSADHRHRSDAALLPAFIASDATAMDALFERYADKLYVYASRQAGRADADDIVQDAFIVLIRKAADVRGTDVGAYLRGVVRLRCLDVLRTRARKAEVALTPGTGDAIDEDIRRLLARSDLDAVATVLHEHTDVLTWQVVVLTADGHTSPEVAKRVGVSADVVRARLSRARKLLRERLVDGAA